MLSYITFTLILVAASDAFFGFDCAGQSLDITTFSLTSVGECEVLDINPIREQKYIQLMQLSDFNYANVMQCKVEIDRTIYHCGMYSHVSIVQNGRREYLLTTTQELCRQLHTTGMLQFGFNAQISGLKPNSTDTRSLPLAGSLDIDGKCTGSQ